MLADARVVKAVFSCSWKESHDGRPSSRSGPSATGSRHEIRRTVTETDNLFSAMTHPPQSTTAAHRCGQHEPALGGQIIVNGTTTFALMVRLSRSAIRPWERWSRIWATTGLSCRSRSSSAIRCIAETEVSDLKESRSRPCGHCHLPAQTDQPAKAKYCRCLHAAWCRGGRHEVALAAFVPNDRPDRMEKPARIVARTRADPSTLRIPSPCRQSRRRERRSPRLVPAISGKKGAAVPHHLDSSLVEDLRAVLDAGLDGLVLPKAEGGISVAALAAIAPDKADIAHRDRETPAYFQLDSYAAVRQSLLGLTWGPRIYRLRSERQAPHTMKTAAMPDLTNFGALADAVRGPCRRCRGDRNGLS